MASHTPCCGISFWIYIMIIVGLVCFAGLMSGLTLGLMSMGLVDLEVLMRSGTPEDRKHAAKILPVVRNQHLLLCTLLIGNALAMEALPIFLDSLVAAWGAILISVTLILLFGEIFPQAVCTRYGLSVGAFMAPFVRVLVMFFFPLAYPISKLLDRILGKGHLALFRRAELKTLVNMHGNEAGKGGELTHDETTIIAGALELTEKTAFHAMTPVSAIFSVDVNAKLDMELMNLIMEKGHSRIPIYSGSPANIIGLILVKNLLAIRAQDEVTVRNLTIRKIPRISESMPLYDILNEFQKGHSHMAVVVKYSKEKSESMLREGSNRRLISARRHSRHTSDAKGVSNYKFSALDIPEGEAPPSETGSPQKRSSVVGSATPDHNTLPSNLAKVTVVNIPNPGVTPINGSPGRLISQRSIGNEATGVLPGRLIPSKSNANEAPTRPPGRLISQRSTGNEAIGILPGRLISQRSIGNEATGLLPGRLISQKSTANEAPTGPLGHPISQQINANEAPTGPPNPLISQKSRKVPLVPEAILDTTKESLPNFPNDEQVVGIITMEDLIEELLQEEIWDETDEYIDVHNKIKVNLLPPEQKSPSSATLSSPPPTATSSFPHTPTPTSPQLSPAPQAPVTTPTWSSGPGSPLVNLTGTAGSHHPQLRTLLHDSIKVPVQPVVEEERPN